MVSLANLEARVLSGTMVSAAREKLLNKGFSAEQVDTLLLKYYQGMKANFDPFMCWVRDKAAWLAITASFTNVHVTGLENVVETLKAGKVALVSSHFSYADVGILPYVFAQGHISNVFYEGGENVVSVPVLRPIVERFFSGIGLIQVKRGAALVREREKSHLYVAVLQAYISELLRQGNNVLNFAGRGRYRTGELQPVNLAVSSSIIQDAEWVVPVAVTYSIIPEASHFAQSLELNPQHQDGITGRRVVRKAVSERGGAISEALSLIRLNRGYGDVYVVFGSPIATSQYARQFSSDDPRMVENRFHSDLTATIKELVTMTPNSALAAALMRLSKLNPQNGCFQLSQLLSTISHTIDQARAHRVLVAPQLQESYGQGISASINYMTDMGALKKSRDGHEILVRDARLLRFYANTIAPTLAHMANRAASGA